MISPLQGEYKPEINLDNVDLPLPVEPTIAIFWPCLISKLKLDKTGLSNLE